MAGLISSVGALPIASASRAQTASGSEAGKPKVSDPNANLMKTSATLLKGMGLKIVSADKNIISFMSKADQ